MRKVIMPNALYHQTRSIQELERASRAPSAAVANIHRELARYHELAAKRTDPVELAIAADL
jgi:hypothetical protein